MSTMDKTTRSITTFLIKAILLTLPVILPALLFYIWADPFRVVRKNADFFPDYNKNHARVGMNKGVATIRNFETQLSHNHRYNAFIFGSSISCYFDARQWASLIRTKSPEATVQPYHFDSSSESIIGMARKIQYLDRKNIPISYALIILDPIIIANGCDDSSPMAIDPPELHTNPLHTLKFHYTFLRASTNADFLKTWIPGRLTDTPLLIGRNPVFEPQPIAYDPLINQESIPLWDSIIATDPTTFYTQHPLILSPHSVTVSKPLLTTENIQALRTIASIFERHNTDYRVIISPNRRKVALHPSDLAILRHNLPNSEGRIFDFSTTHAQDLETDTLLYDNTHYRPVYATRLLHLVYP